MKILKGSVVEALKRGNYIGVFYHTTSTGNADHMPRALVKHFSKGVEEKFIRVGDIVMDSDITDDVCKFSIGICGSSHYHGDKGFIDFEVVIDKIKSLVGCNPGKFLYLCENKDTPLLKKKLGNLPVPATFDIFTI